MNNFSLDEVTLIDQDITARRMLVKQYIASFDMNRLMHTFKINANIPSQALPLGGWEGEKCGLRGHFVGHFLSACAKFSFADKDEHLRTKANNIVDMMEACAQPNGYLSAFEEAVLDTLEHEENPKVWAPYYTLHKILQGLIDCHIYLANTKALAIAEKLALYICHRFNQLSFEKIESILQCSKLNPANEFGGIGISFYTLYNLTGVDEFLSQAKLFDRDYFLEPLAAGEDILENLHANTHLPMILSAIHRYDITGEQKYKQSALHFYNFVWGRTFANGNSSSKASLHIEGAVSEKSEHWGAYGQLENALTGGESESCCAHNTEKILEKLFQWSQETKYLDHIELLKYNAILNSASSETGLSQYHQPMGSGAIKKFSEPFDSFWCCTASGIEAMSEIQKNIWFKDEDTLLLNSFIASILNWKDKKITITQRTDFPDHLTSLITIKAEEPTELTLILKEKNVINIEINSTRIDIKREDGYIIIHRIFINQDEIKIDIAAPIHVVPLQGASNVVAIKYGSVLLAQVGKSKKFIGITSENIVQRLVKRETEKLEFMLNDDCGNCTTFIPLHRVENEEYCVYLDLTEGSTHTSQFSFAKDGSAAY